MYVRVSHQVKERHDGVAKLWASLPTNAQLEQRQSLSEEEMVLESKKGLELV